MPKGKDTALVNSSTEMQGALSYLKPDDPGPGRRFETPAQGDQVMLGWGIRTWRLAPLGLSLCMFQRSDVDRVSLLVRSGECFGGRTSGWSPTKRAGSRVMVT